MELLKRHYKATEGVFSMQQIENNVNEVARDLSDAPVAATKKAIKDWLIEKAIKEASEFIQRATDGDEYEMFKEFAELCILMKAVAEFMPEELEEKACEKALEYYSRKVEGKDYGNPLLDEYSRRNRMYY